MLRRYIPDLGERDHTTYVNNERYQSLREAVNAFLHSEKVELPRCPDTAFEFEQAPKGVPEDFMDSRFDRMEAAAIAFKGPNRESAKISEQVKPEDTPSEPVQTTDNPSQ